MNDAARPVLVGGANVNQRDGAGRTALHWLAETNVSRGAEERAVGFMNLLLEYNVELNAVDSYGSTALDIARQEPACPPLVAPGTPAHCLKLARWAIAAL